MKLPKRRNRRQARPSRRCLLHIALRLAPALLVVPMAPAFAARPMATDDTSTAAPGSCQIEVWTDRTDAARALTLAPACGLPAGFELDTAFSSVEQQQPLLSAAAAGLKWVPEAARFDSPFGAMRFGGIAVAAASRDPTLGWRGDYLALVGLASLTPLPPLNLYLNAFVARRLEDGSRVTGTRAALAWQPDARWLLFVEHLRASDATRIGNAGLRWWLQPDTLGLDLVGTRSAAGGQSLGIGLGWYGIGLP